MLKFKEIRERSVLLLPEDAELKGYREQLDQHVKEQSAAIEQLQQKIAECDEVEAELKEYREHLERCAKEQTGADEQLQRDIAKCKQAEDELKEYRDQLKQYLEEKVAAVEQIQLEITKRKQAERDVSKKMLLDRIKMLQNNKHKDSTKELLSTLASLDKILSQEIREALNSSERALAEKGK